VILHITTLQTERYVDMAERKARFRSRITPHNAASFPLGQIFIEDGPGTNDWKPYGSPYSGAPGGPYLQAESCADETHGRPPWQTGGPFRKISIEPIWPLACGNGTFTSPMNWNLFPYFGRIRYVGGFLPPYPFPGSGEDILNLDTALGIGHNVSPLLPDISSLEDSTWHRTRPPLEKGGVFVAAREMKDVPRMLSTTTRGFLDIYKKLGGDPSSGILAPKKVADHFLNHNFGWVPFIKDMTQSIDNIIFNDQHIHDLMAENNTSIRRKVRFVNSTETTNLGGDASCIMWPGNTAFIQSMLVAPSTYEVIRERETLAYGVGRFKYDIPYLDKNNPQAQGVLGAIRRQLLLHGARISPVNVYKSTKWTWLLDWGTGIGSKLENIQDVMLDNMAAEYLFLVHRQQTKYTIRQFMPFGASSGGTKVFEASRIIKTKQRKESGPFGFGSLPGTLSAKQIAILAALGISRF